MKHMVVFTKGLLTDMAGAFFQNKPDGIPVMVDFDNPTKKRLPRELSENILYDQTGIRVIMRGWNMVGVVETERHPVLWVHSEDMSFSKDNIREVIQPDIISQWRSPNLKFPPVTYPQPEIKEAFAWVTMSINDRIRNS